MWTDVMTGEFLGTTFMILLGGGVVANAMLRGTKGAGSSWLMINAGWGFAVMVGVLVSTSTGSPYGDLNPAVTVAKYLLGVHTDELKVARMMLAELLGCFMGAVLVWAAYYPHGRRPETRCASARSSVLIRQCPTRRPMSSVKRSRRWCSSSPSAAWSTAR
ncbi:aquaporin [Cobetia sp. LC6]|uniref:aquaporin n=1 Tax=Cobetia sp. LC6 TaxID=3050947 RepID=UPI00255765D7|nr:aquaporin [Cobetia sp. LC6]MDL2192011.1 aquaporin [Cobetia sp. LC6]